MEHPIFYRTAQSKEAENLFLKEEYQKVVEILSPLERVGRVTQWDVDRLVRSLHQLERYETLLTIVRRYPYNRLLDKVHVWTLDFTGRLEEAEIVRQRALDYAMEKVERAQPGEEKAQCLNDVGLLVADPKRRVEYFKKSLEEDPDCPVEIENLAYAYMLDGQIDEALKYARIALQLEPGDTKVIELVEHLEEEQRDLLNEEMDSRPTTAGSITSEHSLYENPSDDNVSPQVEDFLRTLETENATLKTENATLKTENATLKTENATMKTENARLKTENAALSRAFDDLTVRCEEHSKRMLDLETQLRERDAELDHARIGSKRIKFS